jgi:hypothetical protein
MKSRQTPATAISGTPTIRMRLMFSVTASSLSSLRAQ